MNRFKQALKDYGTTIKASAKAGKAMATDNPELLDKAMSSIDGIMLNPQRLKDVKKVGTAVSAAVWTGVICAIID